MSDAHFVGGNPRAEEAATILRRTHTVRERCRQLLDRARAGQSRWFTVDDGALPGTARLVADLTRQRYPKGHIPFHSRWRHLEAGGVDRRAQLERLLGDVPKAVRGEAMFDLTFVSVLLDAGAGPDWKYVEPATGQAYTRSEGLAVASFHAFTSGLFSSDRNHPLRVDAEGLRSVLTDHLAGVFQVRENNTMVGLEGRAILLRRLGEVMQEQPEVFGQVVPRPSGIYTQILSPAPDVPYTADVAAHDVLSQILLTCSGIWPSGNEIDGVPLGDCWRHEAVRGEGLTDGWVPFHKLSQWLTYSLLEPIAWSGVQVRGVDQLTGLPEYRNGGLLLDGGVLRLRDEGMAQQTWQAGDELVVEWRALTVALLDEVAVEVRKLLHLDAERLPLACVLEGGTWAAGRELAAKHRNGLPPLKIASDGTLF
ncbi:URC4/urg3 family protein [Ramlibacter sp. USB13]|uniref:URC4/urg3 family protein n=1 Tax=Ramlibacter cellulosilyticus TaxID=2764187 RepID=A0A923MU90_9BURK|nr:URC4/urg3 family protein [Ramlibacter cellulosilyticus]MBC5785363.1 URC4/urg3 family protein [Ramlibacter cellulosilyticus]